jgi:probable rRNA maturation factor
MLQAVWQQYAVDSKLSAAAVQLSFVDRQTICRLHAKYFDDPSETDVITFPLPGPALCGEIYVCIDVALDQAKRYGASIDEELSRLALHGILHLLGFDDLQPQARRRMRELERRFLKQYSFLSAARKAK